jgi:excisionase family DNA binding protein
MSSISSFAGNPEKISLSRASVLLGVSISISTIRSLIDKGELEVTRIPGSHPRVNVEDLERLASKYTSRAGA